MKTIKVTRAQVYAARTIVSLDKQEGRETAPWIKRLAEMELRYE